MDEDLNSNSEALLPILVIILFVAAIISWLLYCFCELKIHEDDSNEGSDGNDTESIVVYRSGSIIPLMSFNKMNRILQYIESMNNENFGRDDPPQYRA